MMVRIRLEYARLALQREMLAMFFAYSSVGLWVIFWFGD